MVCGRSLARRQAVGVKGACIRIGGLTSGFPSRLVQPDTAPRTSSGDLATPGGFRILHPAVKIADPFGLPSDPPWCGDAFHLSGDGTWAPVSPDNVHETVVSPGGQSGSPNRGPSRPSRSSELEEGPGHGPDPRFLCPTASGRARGEARRTETRRRAQDVGHPAEGPPSVRAARWAELAMERASIAFDTWNQLARRWKNDRTGGRRA
jgi:hypothetical protein